MADSLFDPSVLVKFLSDNGLMPKVGFTISDPYFQASRNILATNEVPPTKGSVYSPESRGTAAHEFAHAVHLNALESAANAIKSKRYEKGNDSLTKEEKQFIDTYGKTVDPWMLDIVSMITGRQTRDQVLSSIDSIKRAISSDTGSFKDTKDEYSKYRLSPTETIGWGVGNATRPGAERQMRLPHYDSTMATQISFLMDMYNALPKSIKEQVKTARIKEQTESRQKKAVPSTFVDLEADPFSATIK